MPKQAMWGGREKECEKTIKGKERQRLLYYGGVGLEGIYNCTMGIVSKQMVPWIYFFFKKVPSPKETMFLLLSTRESAYVYYSMYFAWVLSSYSWALLKCQWGLLRLTLCIILMAPIAMSYCSVLSQVPLLLLPFCSSLPPAQTNVTHTHFTMRRPLFLPIQRTDVLMEPIFFPLQVSQTRQETRTKIVYTYYKGKFCRQQLNFAKSSDSDQTSSMHL